MQVFCIIGSMVETSQILLVSMLEKICVFGSRLQEAMQTHISLLLVMPTLTSRRQSVQFVRCYCDSLYSRSAKNKVYYLCYDRKITWIPAVTKRASKSAI